MAGCDELKVLVHRPENLAFAEEMAGQGLGGQRKAGSPILHLQTGLITVDGQSLTIHYLRRHLQWQLRLQSNKLQGVR
ncbi:hypothetical protein [Cyanobium sp. FACHB-13342]|uniref:hypothetical protein n=1 Tax=Cyanobium sp. FACHB-13342 TaxID=2692793 RepID=UPI001680DF0E|nr:hypothetical protein [Cyanobium sp. FACHB-13342]MBD2424108.1 hypothetical protein [Cyanobium sp. FACHB-13342]